MRVRTFVPVLVAAALVLPACADVSKEKEETPEPAELVAIEGSDRSAIIVEPEAVDRVGIETGTVTSGGSGRTTMPAAAVFYGLEGETWTYTNPEENTYVRTPIVVDDIQGDTAFVSDGPKPGTRVVTVGAPELFGVEEGVGH
jgi:hypothetical protein